MSDYEAVEKYYTGETELEHLSEKQREIFHRLDYCDNLLRSALIMNDGSVAKQMHRHFKVKFPSYSIRTAYKDIDATKTIHKSISRIDKDYEKLRILWLIDWEITEAMTPPVNLRELNAAISSKIKVLGLDKNNDAIDWSKLVSHPLYIQINTGSDNGVMLDINELMKIKGSLKDDVLSKIELAHEIKDPGEFLDVHNEL